MHFFLRIFSSRKSRDEKFLLAIKQLIGFKPKNLGLYRLALRHSSSNSTRQNTHNNERLEFLGDAVLGAIVSDHLYKAYPNEAEGFLTSMRSKIVSRSNLNNIGKKIGLEPLIVSRLDRQKGAKSLYGDALEAVIGAVYLDLGASYAKQFVHTNVLAAHVDLKSLESHIISYKGLIIEWAQKHHKAFDFKLVDSWGKQHSKTFKISLYIDGDAVATGLGASKKQAEETAAKTAFNILDLDGPVEKV